MTTRDTRRPHLSKLSYSILLCNVHLCSHLIELLAEAATFCQSRFAASGLGNLDGATRAKNRSVDVGVNGLDVVATRALDIHEVTVWSLH
jgi:hypothetical protein